MDGIRLLDGPMRCGRCWRRTAARIRQIFHGHLHRPIGGNWHGIPLFSLRGSAFDVALDLAPPPRPADAWRWPRTPCYAVVRVEEDSIVAHTRTLLRPA